MLIKIDQVSFSYNNKKQILDSCSINVPRGSIYGFIGSNGAGKSTLIKLLLGLLKPYEGTISLNQKNIIFDRIEILKEAGWLIETPFFYEHLTCFQNLKLLQYYYDFEDKEIERVLCIVELASFKNVKYSKLSMGMKKRLAFAKAIIHSPKILILDEPFNELDPEWIIKMSIFLSQLNSKGTTIFFSSHLLAEMEKIASHIGILKNGNMCIESTTREIKKNLASKKIGLRLSITKNLEKIFSTEEYNINIIDDQFVEFIVFDDYNIKYLFQKLIENSYQIIDIYSDKLTLEDFYIQKF